jgi:hypothetical protein
VLVDKHFCDRGIFENVNIQVEVLGIVNEFVEGSHCILGPVELPVQIFDIGLELGPIVTEVSR